MSEQKQKAKKIARRIPKRGKPRLNRLSIQNYKIFKEIELDFPFPVMGGDPDILVFGSQNGMGKTSVLEACSLLIFLAFLGKEAERFFSYTEGDFPIDLGDLIIRAGAEDARIKGSFEIDGRLELVELIFPRNRFPWVQKESFFRKFIDNGDSVKLREPQIFSKYLNSIIGFGVDPVILPGFMYFNSYRKIAEGNPEIGMLVETQRQYRRRPFGRSQEITISIFKMEILRLLMSQAGLFENIHARDFEKSLNVLNGLMTKYAGGYIEKLRPSPNNALEFRISPSAGGPSFTFDGLSSGQKEIISTLFLIWINTKARPGIVLIDEPELHLNPEWQSGFVNYLNELVPANQYIIATHSEDIFRSVEESRRMMLSKV